MRDARGIGNSADKGRFISRQIETYAYDGNILSVITCIEVTAILVYDEKVFRLGEVLLLRSGVVL